ncbi:MAG: sugar phosphate isomerase/epimerase [Tannerella sp.]|nr:sugar phosphate isomerase/epimerase [Tannerella sp.]
MKTFPILLAFFLCGLLSCTASKISPTYAVCGKLSDYPALQAAGYDFFEPTVSAFLSPAESDSVFMSHLAEMKRLNAKPVSCIIFLPGDYTIVGEAPRHDDIVDWGEKTFRRANQAGIRYIVFGSGGARRVPEGFDREKAMQQFIAVCKRLAPVAQKQDVTLVVEPLNRAETNLINSLQEGAAVVEAVDHPNVRLLCDIYHMMRENEPASEIVKYGKYIRHCHIAEKETRSAPGTNGDDFRPYFAALKQIGYRGCISIECSWDDFSSRLAPALEYMKRQFDESDDRK